MEFDDDSPFGLQGLSREGLTILKPDCINKLAMTLALRATADQIRDPGYVRQVLSWHPEWLDEYQIVHLIERSLWIQGHCDLVMTMTRNPSQIPDNPPAKIRRALTRAIALHPEATVWYGVPLFGEDKNEDGLPIPVTAAQVRDEADRRIQAAVRHALRWGWSYRAAVSVCRIPARCWQAGQAVRGHLQRVSDGMTDHWRKVRMDFRRRTRAQVAAERERTKYGESFTVIPPHQTWLGQNLEATLHAADLMGSYVTTVSPYLTLVSPLVVAKFAPVLLASMTVVSCDPFLFIELPGEPGKLRHLGHWYWQLQDCGGKKLHLHV
jgi:hypothetical protein